MCRFLLCKFDQPQNPYEILRDFSQMSELSRSPDGDQQEDGWGVAFLTGSGWQVQKSINPIWQDREIWAEIPETTILVVHARSASFPAHKGFVEFNQPFIEGDTVFVFNGLLKGVSLPGIPGKIGAQKIWHMLQKEIDTNPPGEALARVKETLAANSKEIPALNIGLVDKENLYFLNHFSTNPEYYQMHKWNIPGGEVICSSKF